MSNVLLTTGVLGKIGSLDGQSCLITERGQQGAVVYGPYERREPGRYRAIFQVGLAGETQVLGDPVCAMLDVVANDGTSCLAEQRLLLSDLKTGLSASAIDFVVREPRVIEYRLHSTGQIGLNVSTNVQIETLPRNARALPAGSIERSWYNEREFLDGFLRNVTGLIHVGANRGQERRYYWLLGLDVIWVEPIVETFNALVDNIASYNRQRAVNALLSEEDGEEYDFQISNQGAGSSSILPFEDHSKIWPDIEYVETRKIRSTTLELLMQREQVNTEEYQALTLDVEGAELLVLKGTGDLIKGFRYVKCEVADFPSRTGTPTTAELDAFLTRAGFAQLIRRSFAMGPGNEGTYWDIVWKRLDPGVPFQEPGYKMPMVAHPLDVAGLEKCE